MRFPRPQFSLLALLIFMGLVGVGAKLWVGPHREVETIIDTYDEDLIAQIMLNTGCFPRDNFDWEYSRRWNGRYYHTVSFRINYIVYVNHVDYMSRELEGNNPDYEWVTFDHPNQRKAVVINERVKEYIENACIAINGEQPWDWLHTLQHFQSFKDGLIDFNRKREIVLISNKGNLYHGTTMIGGIYGIYIIKLQPLELNNVSDTLRPRVFELLEKVKRETETAERIAKP
jgi:hypothetical protein